MEEEKEGMNPGAPPSFIHSFSKLSTELAEAQMSSSQQEPTSSTTNGHVPTGESGVKALPENPVTEASTEKSSTLPEQNGSKASPPIAPDSSGESPQGISHQNPNPNLNYWSNPANYVGAYQPYYPHHYPSYPMQTPYPYYGPPPGHAPAAAAASGWNWRDNPLTTSQPTPTVPASYAHPVPPPHKQLNLPSSSRRSFKPSNSFRRRQASSVVKSMAELADLGNWQLLEEDEEMYRIIVTYVNNSSGVKESEGTVKVHQIHHLKTGRFSFSMPNPLDIQDFKMMLWWKTSPEGVKHLEQKQDGCIAFYDRIARAFSVKPEGLQEPFRQIILLCQVTLGDKLTHSLGYRYWRDKVLPPTHDSIKGAGRLRPTWDENETIKNVIIPIGKTTVDTKLENPELEYNEYLVFQADKIKIKYAVDVEIIPKEASTSSPHSADPMQTQTLEHSKVDPPMKSGIRRGVTPPIHPHLHTASNTPNYMGGAPPYHQYQYQGQTFYPYQWPHPGQAPTYDWSGNQIMTSQPPQFPQSSYAQSETARPDTTSEESESAEEEDPAPNTKNCLKKEKNGLHPKRGNAKLDRSKSNPSEEKKKTEVASKPSVITNPNQLNALGTCQKLSRMEDYRVIVKYARNSAGEDAHVEIMQLYGLASAAKRLTPKTDQLDLLLWFKTSPGSVEHLSRRADKCVAFYDRIVRAFAESPDEFAGGTLRQIIILCAVSLGKPHKSDKGYHYWKDKHSKIPPGNNSVHAVGRFHPDWEDNREVNSVLVPCGKTQVKRKGSRGTPLKYSEYLVFEANKISPLYAVDVKITSKVIASSTSESD